MFDLKAGRRKAALDALFDARPDKAPMPQLKHCISFLLLSPNGRHIFSTIPDQPNEVRVHSADTGELITAKQVPGVPVVCALSPDGSLFAWLCQDGLVSICDSKLTGKQEAKKTRCARPRPGGFCFVGNRSLAMVVDQETIDLIDKNTMKVARSFQVRGKHVNCIAGSMDGRFLAAGYGLSGRTIGGFAVWDTDTGKLVKEIQ